MKPVVICLFLIGFSLAGSVSASGDGYDSDWYNVLIDTNPYAGCPTCVLAWDDDGLVDPNPYAGCPTCVFAWDDNGLVDPNPYAGCPTCALAWDDDGLVDPNPYAGCPTCVFAWDNNGLVDPNPYAGCPTCTFIFDTGIESDLNSLDECPTCGITVSSTTNGYSSLILSSKSSPGSTLYTFANGTPIPADYVCPIHGIYCPDDPRPVEDRPGYAAAISEARPTLPTRSLPETTAEFMSLFSNGASIPKSSRLEGILYRSS